MNNEFLKFADEIITLANKTGTVVYDDETRDNYEYYFDEDDAREMNTMNAIASLYGFSFTKIVKKGESEFDDYIVLGFKISK